MYAFLLQNWVTLRGAGGAQQNIIQSEDCWLDLGPYQDVIAWLDVKETTQGGAALFQMLIESAPNKDQALFTTLTNFGTAIAPLGVGIQINKALMTSGVAGFNPLARWLRWNMNVTGAGQWDVTFRCWIVANSPGPGMGLAPLQPPLREVGPSSPVPSFYAAPGYSPPTSARGPVGGAPAPPPPTSARAPAGLMTPAGYPPR